MRTARGVVSRHAVAAAFLLGFAAGCGGGGSGGSTLTPGGVDVGVDAEAIATSWDVIDRFFPDDHCAVVEGAVDAAGTRRILRFDTLVENRGDADLHVGSPTDPIPPLTSADFYFSPCHGHYHFLGWADYHLEDGNGAIVAQGHKQAFCLRDSISLFGGFSHGYTCDDQGITSGWADVYDRTLDGQWIDVTGVAEGDYFLVVTVNAQGKIPEVDVRPNTARVPVHLNDPAGPP